MNAVAARGSQVINSLRDFIQKAEKAGKYPHNSAVGFLTAVNLVEEGLLPDEPDEPKYISEHLEEIYHRQMDKLNLSAASVQTYIARVKRALSDYQQYGLDAKAFYAWKPRILQRPSRSRAKENHSESREDSAQTEVARMSPPAASSESGLRTLVWSLRPDVSIQIQLPTDLNQKDVERLTKLLRLEAELAES